MNTAEAVTVIDHGLRAAARPERAEGEKAYLKSDLDFFGVSVPAMRTVAKGLLGDWPDITRSELLDVVVALWNEPIFEYRMMAVELLTLREPLLEIGDFELLERLLRESKTWALVDNLAISAAGPLAARLEESGPVLDRWSSDEDFWIRRSAMLALLKPLRNGGGDFERFTRYADAMLEEKEFFIRKAIGWVLRDTSRKRPELVADWVGPRTHRMSGVTIREAIKKLPPDQAEAYLQAYREKRPAR